MKGHPWDAKNCIAKDSRSWQVSTNRSLWTSMCCNRAHNWSQCALLKNTCKKVFGLQLLNTVTFHVSQNHQHIAAAPINKIILCFFPPCLDQLLNKCSNLLVVVYLTQNELQAIEISHNDIQQINEVLDSFQLTAKTSFILIPIPSS